MILEYGFLFHVFQVGEPNEIQQVCVALLKIVNNGSYLNSFADLLRLQDGLIQS